MGGLRIWVERATVQTDAVHRLGAVLFNIVGDGQTPAERSHIRARHASRVEPDVALGRHAGRLFSNGNARAVAAQHLKSARRIVFDVIRGVARMGMQNIL